MDSLITAAARALAAGDPLGALKRVALRTDAAGLALRGVAMAQLGEFARARTLLRSAERAFGPGEAVPRARCLVAQAEIALVSRDLRWPAGVLESARQTLEQYGDLVNAAHARCLEVRRLVLVGDVTAAAALLRAMKVTALPQAARATHALVVAGLAMRRLQTRNARAALARAALAAQRSGIVALVAEVRGARQLLEAPAARLTAGGQERSLRLEEVETVFASKALIVDGCRNVVTEAGRSVSLARRPVLFALARELAAAWPMPATRDQLIFRAFRARSADDSHRARLRVEVGRLRRLLRPLAGVSATQQGFALTPRRAREVVVLARPADERHGALLAFLSDGEAWSSSALALALGSGQRSVQRALEALARAGKVQSYGHGRARRWTAPTVPGFTTSLLLPTLLPTQ